MWSELKKSESSRSSDVVLETRALISRRLEDKNESLGLGLENLVFILNIWSWSWSQSWRKSLAVFQDFCCNSWRQWARQTMAFCDRQQKQFAIRKPLFERTFCAPCTSASVERVFNNGGYLLGHTDARKAQCIDCGKLLSLGSNKPGKQTVHGLKCHLEKYHKDIYTLYMRKVESHQQGPPAKRRNWMRYWRRIVGLTWWLNVRKRRKKTLILSGDFRFCFSAENECPFSFSFRFRP